MLSGEEYLRKSMEYHLFWLRIMKEHAVFIESSMPPPQTPLANQADQFRRQFEGLLADTIRMANGILPKETLRSGQFYTDYTETAEQAVQKFTGIDVNRTLTRMEYEIQPFSAASPTGGQREQDVTVLNQRILNQTKAFIKFQTDLLNSQSSCQIFTFLYTADIDHILREAVRYSEALQGLLSREDLERSTYIPFWNQNMMEHAKSMRGLFDPSEDGRFDTADSFVKAYTSLIQNQTASIGDDLTNAKNLSYFKADTTEGILGCKIKSLMSPLYTDHLLREANHYIYLLNLPA